MAQRIYILCRSNHDPITFGSLACETLLGRKHTHETDYIRWAGNSENTQNPTKCHVLVDCSVDDRDPGTKIHLLCCKASFSGIRCKKNCPVIHISLKKKSRIISKFDISPMLYQRLKTDYAWDRRGPP